MIRFVSAAVVGVSLIAGLGQAAEPAFFRADHGLAADDARALPETLDDSELVWRQPLAPGHSTPCVVGGALYLTTFEHDTLATVALDRQTGKQKWRQVAPAKTIESFHKTGSPAASSPACDGKRVYSFFGSYGLLCYDLDGNLVWEKPLGPFQDEFGAASSPVLLDGKLLLNEDHDRDSFLLAVDPATGKTLWQTRRDGFTRSYSTPILWTVGKRKQVVVAGALQLAGYDLETGEQLWSLDGLARIVNTTPTLANGTLFVATWSPGGDSDSRIAMESWKYATEQWDKNKDGKLTREEVNNPDVIDRFYRIDLDQDQGLDQREWEKYARVFELARNSIKAIKPAAEGLSESVEIVWEYEKGLPYVPSPLAYRNVVFLAKDGGILTTLDAQTGKFIKQGRLAAAGTYMASPVAGDGKVYVVSDSGTVSVVQADGKWNLLGSRDLGERTVASPVIADGQIFIRTEAAIYCFARR